jgi:hypothetical protein
VTADVVSRIRAVDLSRPRVERRRVERAVAVHLEALGLPPRPVRWADDVASVKCGTRVVRDAQDWWRARGRARVAARNAAGAADGFRDDRWEGPSPVAGVVAVWVAAGEAILSGRWTGADTTEGLLPPNPVAPWLLDATSWPAKASSEPASPPVVRWRRACEAMVDAYAAGLGFFWVDLDDVVVVPRPRLSVVEGRLHDARGPAVEWATGERYWFWRGIRVPQQAIESPETLTVEQILGETNLERRRVLLERMGYDRYVRRSGGRVVAEDRFGRLWTCPALSGELEPLVLVEVENSTPEPDGTSRRYFLRVPPFMRSPHEAVAWTFGLRPSQYAPLTET